MLEKKFGVIENFLLERDENAIIEMEVQNYNKRNYFFAFLYDKKIRKYKILYINVDILDIEYIDRYCCYQFVNDNTAKFLINTIKDNKNKYSDDFKNRKSVGFDDYFIKIKTDIDGEKNDFLCTQYIENDWLFLYEVIVIFFEHAPAIVHELCYNMLYAIDNNGVAVKFNGSILCDIKDDLDKYFGMSEIDRANILKEKTTYFESGGNKSYAIIDDTLNIMEYQSNRNILSYYSEKKDVCYIIAMILKERERDYKNFIKLLYVDDASIFSSDSKTKGFYYYCYGVKDNALLVIKGNEKATLSLDEFIDGKIRFVSEVDTDFIIALEKELEKKYSKKLYDKYLKSIKINF